MQYALWNTSGIHFKEYKNSLLRTLLKPGFEISDVLKIDDKDYAITFSLYFRSVLSIENAEPLSYICWCCCFSASEVRSIYKSPFKHFYKIDLELLKY